MTALFPLHKFLDEKIGLPVIFITLALAFVLLWLVPVFFIPVLLFGLFQAALVFGFQKLLKKTTNLGKTLKIILPLTILYFLGTFIVLMAAIGAGFIPFLIIPIVWLLVLIALNLFLIKEFTGSFVLAIVIFLLSVFLGYQVFVTGLYILYSVIGFEGLLELLGMEVVKNGEPLILE